MIITGWSILEEVRQDFLVAGVCEFDGGGGSFWWRECFCWWRGVTFDTRVLVIENIHIRVRSPIKVNSLPSVLEYFIMTDNL